MNTLLNYPGAKWGMAKEIVALMPPHRSYLEPFFGSGAVLFNKPPSAIETVNDIDGDIVNFFTILREYPTELAADIAMTPYSREVFNDAHENRGSSEYERAYKFAIRSKMGHGFKTYQKTEGHLSRHLAENRNLARNYRRGRTAIFPAILLTGGRNMSQFYAQLSDGSTIKKQADRMEIANESIRVYDGEQLVAYIDLGAALYAHLSVKREVL